VFRFDATGDMNCTGGITLDRLTVTWKGHADGTHLFPTDTTVGKARVSVIRVELPTNISGADAPIRVDVLVKSMEFFDHVRRVGGQSVFTAS
jgi:hypothetical protein